MWAIVTGGSRGFGFALAKKLAKQGYNLVLVALHEENLVSAKQRLEDELSQKGFSPIEILTYATDLSVMGAAEKLHSWTKAKGISCDVLVNDAGIYFYKHLVDMSVEEQNGIIVLDVVSLTTLCRLYAAEMADSVEQARKQGLKKHCYILNVASYSVYMPIAGLSLYAGCKAYVKTMSRCIGRELKSKGVSVTAVAPAGIDTDLMGLRPDIRKIAGTLGFLGSPDRIARYSLRAMKWRMPYHIPGWYNILFIPFLSLCQPLFKRVL